MRPDHLFLGSPADNSADMVAKGRSATGDRHSMRIHPDRIARGERAGAAKLSEADVVAIRRLYVTERPTLATIASQFGIGHVQVWRIIHNLQWTHIPLSQEDLS